VLREHGLELPELDLPAPTKRFGREPVRGGQAQLRRYQAVRISASQFVDNSTNAADSGKKEFSELSRPVLSA
jgi:hypothetical protein